MGVRGPHRPHLVEDDRHVPVCELPGGFRSGEAAADDVDRIHHGVAR